MRAVSSTSSSTARKSSAATNSPVFSRARSCAPAPTPPPSPCLAITPETLTMKNALAAMPIIDVDTHFTEPPELWTDLAPASLKARAPRVQSDADGNQFWIVDEDMRLGT